MIPKYHKHRIDAALNRLKRAAVAWESGKSDWSTRMAELFQAADDYGDAVKKSYLNQEGNDDEKSIVQIRSDSLGITAKETKP